MYVEMRRGRVVMGIVGLVALVSVMAFAMASDRAPGQAQENDDGIGPGPFQLFVPNLTNSAEPGVVDKSWPAAPTFSEDGTIACAPLGEVCTGGGCTSATDENGAPIPRYDPELARRLLVEAGWLVDEESSQLKASDSFFVFEALADGETIATATVAGLPVPGEQPGDWGADGIFDFVVDAPPLVKFNGLDEMHGVMCVSFNKSSLDDIGIAVAPEQSDLASGVQINVGTSSGGLAFAGVRAFPFLGIGDDAGPTDDGATPGVKGAGYVGSAGSVAAESEVTDIVRWSPLDFVFEDIRIALLSERNPVFPDAPTALPLDFYNTGPGQVELTFEITTPILIQNPIADVNLGQFGTAPLPLPRVFLPGVRHYGSVVLPEELEVPLGDVVLTLRDWSEPDDLPPLAQLVAGPPVIVNAADDLTMQFNVFNGSSATVNLGQTTWSSSCFNRAGEFVGYWNTEGVGTLDPGERATLASGNHPVVFDPASAGFVPDVTDRVIVDWIESMNDIWLCEPPTPDQRPQ